MKRDLKKARGAMIVIGLVGLALAYGVELIPGFGLKYLWWFLNTAGACLVFPLVLSLFWDRLTARGILMGSGVGLIVGLPLVIYASIAKNDVLLAATNVGILAFSALSCVLFAKRKQEHA